VRFDPRETKVSCAERSAVSARPRYARREGRVEAIAGGRMWAARGASVSVNGYAPRIGCGWNAIGDVLYTFPSADGRLARSGLPRFILRSLSQSQSQSGCNHGPSSVLRWSGSLESEG
jgi:hypothetical protein